MAVYLLHFDRPIGNPNNPRGQAQHYLGWTKDALLGERMEEHASGTGARIMAAVMQYGVGWEMVRVWKRGTRTLERQLKNRKQAKLLCPYCQKEHSHNRQ